LEDDMAPADASDASDAADVPQRTSDTSNAGHSTSTDAANTTDSGDAGSTSTPTTARLQAAFLPLLLTLSQTDIASPRRAPRTRPRLTFDWNTARERHEEPLGGAGVKRRGTQAPLRSTNRVSQEIFVSVLRAPVRRKGRGTSRRWAG
jgi:hypothetical protein